MKSLKEYLAEAELFESTPSIGDVFEIEIAREEIVIESTVVGYMDDGIVIEADDTMMKILMHVGYLTEDSNMPTDMPTARDSDRDKSNDNNLEKNYMDKDSGATPPGRPTRNAVDAKPLIEPKDKKDPKDYMVREDDFKWGQASWTDKNGGVNKYDPKTNSYKSTGPVTPNDPETSMTVIDTSNRLDKNGNTVRDDFTSQHFARNPETGTGSYSVSRSNKDKELAQDYQQNVGKPWMDYSINKAKHDADTMLADPNLTDINTEYRPSPQGPMAPFRATTNEAEYQGRKVALGKPMAGDVKKSKVYVKNAKGNVVKVNFGDPNMTIKKSNPARRKSFRARHNCANPGPRTSARYWSCRAW